MIDTLKLVLVEDNPGDVRLIREFVAQVCDVAVDIAVAGSIQDATDVLSKAAVDAVLLDLSLPDSKGLQSLKQIKAAAIDTPVVVLTGLGDDALALRAVHEGAQDYLLKGDFDGRSLLRSVRYAIERSRAERTDRERRALESALNAMDRLLAVVGHELRTPLASLRLLSEYMLTDQHTAMKQWEEHLTAINSEVVKMTHMVNNLLEAARLDSGISQWNWGTVRLFDIATEVLLLLRPLIDSDRLTMSCENIPKDLCFHGDSDAIRRLLVNLVSNAAKHTRRGRIDVTAECYPSGGCRWIRVHIKDNGAGMSEDVLARLGDAFAINSGTAGSSETGGTGLGLAICKGIAGAHGGAIAVSSRLGHGSEFTVSLRGDLSEPAPIPAEMKILREAAA